MKDLNDEVQVSIPMIDIEEQQAEVLGANAALERMVEKRRQAEQYGFCIMPPLPHELGDPIYDVDLYEEVVMADMLA